MPPNNGQPVAPAQYSQQPPMPQQMPAGQAYPQQAPTPGAPFQAQPDAQPATDAEKQRADKKAAQTNKTTTQKSLLFSELRDDMIIMSDGSYRAVVACESINFDLMSSREREGVEYSYQNFLNSLEFPIQIFIRSQRVDIAPYLEKLMAVRRSQDNMLLGVLMDDYINFIDALAEEANIMDKSFYIAIPFFPEGDAGKLVEQGKGFFQKFFGGNTATGVTKIDQTSYEKARDEMRNRVDSVMSGLFQINVRCARLNTKELGKLYYNVYNPDTAINQPLGDFENGLTSIVQKGDGEAPRVSMGLGGVE